jgi:hypothetical protein
LGRLLPAAFDAASVRYRRDLAVGARTTDGRLCAPEAVMCWGLQHAADSDDFGQSFRAEVGHLFRLMPAGHSD